mmetsp:Transcript_9676/g.8521  ORF Transcript_9676/g.8521 Transcript_9676/m.8521 type:complete len:128 (+) Transcript_9676:89-472(+)
MIWSRISNGLFDYESSAADIKRDQIILKDKGLIMNNKEYITYSQELKNSLLKDKEDDPKYLAYAEYTDENEYTIKRIDTATSFNSRLWLIIRGTYYGPGMPGYKIQPNDIIKIGRVVLRVREINSEN